MLQELMTLNENLVGKSLQKGGTKTEFNPFWTQQVSGMLG